MTDVTRFFACYILTSLKDGCKDHTYIGFTINPKRRLRQHNGEITNGAARTSKKRPWEMIAVVYGFPTKKEALAFEWNWQKPFTSKLLRNTANGLVAQKTMGNRWKLKFKIRIMFEMLQIAPWNRFPLIVHWLGRNPINTPSLFPPFPSPPSHVKQIYAPMSELDMGLENDANDDQDELASGEEDHSDEDDLNIPDNDSATGPFNRTSSGTAMLASTGSLNLEEPFSLASSFSQRNQGASSSLQRTNSSSSSSNNATSNGPGPRRSLSANSIVRPAVAVPILPDIIEYHNKSIDEDDDSFLHVPAFAVKPTTAAPKKVASARSRPANTGTLPPQPIRTVAENHAVPASSNQMQVDELFTVICKICDSPVTKIDHGLCCSKEECHETYHIVCWATKALQEEREAAIGNFVSLVPTSSSCLSCQQKHRWMDLIRHKQRILHHGNNPLRSLVPEKM
jgi:predicted GIY-YIG superfamily endonuclease